MKFFGWMQGKFNGGQTHSKNSRTATCPTHHMKLQEPPKEEFKDWPRGILAIGTLGNRENHRVQNNNTTTTSSSPDLSEFTPEEIGKLKKELTKLLSKKSATAATAADLPLNRFLNCPSSLEVDRRLSTTVITNNVNPADDDHESKEEEIDRTVRVILGRCKDIIDIDNASSSNKAIGKKSISYLLKKMFVCSSSGGGLPRMPSLKLDPLPESRMERLLRAMLKNTMKSDNCSGRTSSAKKCIKSAAKKGKGKSTATTENVKDDRDENDGSKWVKTDSEYIVLEI